MLDDAAVGTWRRRGVKNAVRKAKFVQMCRKFVKAGVIVVAPRDKRKARARACPTGLCQTLWAANFFNAFSISSWSLASSQSRLEYPTSFVSGLSAPRLCSSKIAGISLRAAKSPVIPKMTKVQGAATLTASTLCRVIYRGRRRGLLNAGRLYPRRVNLVSAELVTERRGEFGSENESSWRLAKRANKAAEIADIGTACSIPYLTVQRPIPESST